MKKLALSAIVVLTFIAYAVQDKLNASSVDNITTSDTPDNTLTLPTNNTGDTSGILPTDTPSQTNSTGGMGSHMSSMMGYKDGQYTGDVTDAYYGLVQVRLTIGGGKISDVEFLRYPNDRRTSIYINSQAMPYLKNEAIQAQSANVNIITGATATSEAFIQSMQTALAKAKS